MRTVLKISTAAALAMTLGAALSGCGETMGERAATGALGGAAAGAIIGGNATGAIVGGAAGAAVGAATTPDRRY